MACAIAMDFITNGLLFLMRGLNLFFQTDSLFNNYLYICKVRVVPEIKILIKPIWERAHYLFFEWVFYLQNGKRK